MSAEEVNGIIYLITNRVNGKQYVGQTITRLEARWSGHCNDARRRKSCSALARAINKYGRDAFTIEEIGSASSLEELNALEQTLIVQYNTRKPSGYNIKPGGDSHIVSDETRARLSAALKGRKRNLSPELLAKLRARMLGRPAPNKGKKLSPEVRAKMSASRTGKPSGRKGRPLPPEVRAKIAASNIGRKHTPETIEKMRAGLTGQKRTPEQCARIGAARKGAKLSPEARAKISAALRVRVITDKTRAKLSAINKGRKFPTEVGAKISAAIRGRKLTPEHRAKISARFKGKPRPELRGKPAWNRGVTHTDEVKAKIGAKSKGRKHTPEVRARMATAQTGRKHAPETLTKMSASISAALNAKIEVERAKILEQKPGMVTLERAAEMAGVNRECIRQRIKRGDLPNAQMECAVGILFWLIPVSDLENFKPRKRPRQRTWNRVTITCLQCGKNREYKSSLIASGRGKYCSMKCGYEYRKQKVKKTCAVCGSTEIHGRQLCNTHYREFMRSNPENRQATRAK